MSADSPSLRFLRRGIQKLALPAFPLFERLGLHVVPAHFDYPIPSSANLPDELFETHSDCPGLEWNHAEQRRYLREVFPRYVRERAFEENRGLNVIDAAIAYAMVRVHKPRQLIEVGSGASTSFLLSACERNAAEGHPYDYVAIDPYPSLAVQRLAGKIQLRREKVQNVPVRAFRDCDLLFIDSSHNAGIGSDVNYEQLEILPRVKPGCVVHFHDIVLPGEYWKDWVRGRRFFWTEQYLLRAFLTFNTQFDVLWASRYMQLQDAQALAAAFPEYRSDFRITSFWIARKHA